MKEKTDKLKEKIEKDYKDMMAVINSTSLPLFVEDTIEDMHILISTLIAENKELKDSNVELATTIDCLQTDLKEIKEEYSAEQKYEMENTIPKSKAKEEIDGKFKEAKGLYERGVQPQAQYTMKLLRDLEQSLLGKE